MKLSQFSVRNILVRSSAVIKRFPLAILTCLAGTIIGITMLHVDDVGVLPNVLLTLSLAAPIFVSIVLVKQAKSWDQIKTLTANAIAIGLLVLYYALLPEMGEGYDLLYIRHVMWTIGFVLLIAFIPFTLERGKDVVMACWQYNRVLVFALVVTAIWTGALMTGISIALTSIDFLFDISIDGERYTEIWFILVGLFAPLFFLNRLPVHPEAQKKLTDYPKEVRLFSQFVLVPLVAVYFLILYAYTIQILVNNDWPEGQVAYMILGFSFLGVVTYLALYPLRSSVTWIRRAGDLLFIAMIPQVIVLYRAIWFRISEYGMTENRYFVVVFGCWLLVMATYYLGSKQKDIRVIPATIFLIAFLSSFGPWGAFQVAERSQIHRLEMLLVNNELLVDETITNVSSTNAISQYDETEISEIIRYLANTHGLDGIQPWFEEDLTDLYADEVVEDILGLTYYNAWESRQRRYVNLSAEQAGGQTNRFDYWMQVSNYMDAITLDETSYLFSIDNDEATFSVASDQEVLIVHDINDELQELFEGQTTQLNMDEAPVIAFENDRIVGELHITWLSGENVRDVFELSFVEGVLLFSLK